MPRQLLALSVAVLLGITSPIDAQGIDADEEGFYSLEIHSIERDRDMARDRFEVSQTSVKELAQRRTAAITACLSARLGDYYAGRGLREVLVESQNELFQSRYPLRAKLKDNSDTLEDRWKAAWELSRLSRAKYEAGRLNEADYFHDLYLMHDVEVEIALRRPKSK